MERSSSSVSTTSRSADIIGHNIWNPMMELPLHVQIGGIFRSFVDETDLVRIVHSCHVSLDLLCDKGGRSRFRLTPHRSHSACGEF